MEYKEARLRNLKIKLYKVSLSKGKVLEHSHSIEAINKKLFFKKSDIKDHIESFFNSSNEKYLIKPEIKKEFDNYFEKYDQYSSEQEELKMILKTNYEYIRDIYINLKPTEEANEKIQKTKEIAAKLHWVYLPIYPEQTIINSGIIPEENTEEYYEHFHTIEDLYRVIYENAEIEWNSIEGDINLNSPLKMRVFSSRWGHYDTYSVKRTMKGWNFKHLSYDVDCSKDGTINSTKEDGLYNILAHDSIQYPYDGVRYALRTLWKIADSTSMSSKELEIKLQDIADWINAVEKATKSNQPNWVGYY
ncbi:hypothetical protein K7887_01785 [Sutcliffiella horikoshii]|uniref:hypothetical protein n=1 Tax=Sutcliffiella horikoshii TaxID=79883 RepID=UPI001CBB1C8E|nr:hypothetical protein [Sutcliffiella horikoshii]UAL47733.1 hypothetical protein K7887_01785 [Sutcliffiella horikoshii]